MKKHYLVKTTKILRSDSFLKRKLSFHCKKHYLICVSFALFAHFLSGTVLEVSGATRSARLKSRYGHCPRNTRSFSVVTLRQRGTSLAVRCLPGGTRQTGSLACVGLVGAYDAVSTGCEA